jgi:thioredoxin reductase (NADPH)
MSDERYDVVVIGSGPAGLTAAIYTSRAFLKTLVIAGFTPGGQLMLTSEVENFPGFKDGILGPELMEEMKNQAKRFGSEFKNNDVTSVEKKSDIFEIKTGNNEVYSTKSIIVATGASARWLGLESEQRLMGKGVSACATCDGFFFKEKVVAVVGGGDSAMEEASYLTKFAKKVYILVRKSEDQLKASKFMHKKAKDNEKIEFKFNTEVKEVLGADKVESISLLNNDTNEESELVIDGLFVAIGHKPNTEFLKGIVDLDERGYVVVKDNTRTNLEGVFVAGDVADAKYRQAITAAGMGCKAALDTEEYLADHGVEVNPGTLW